MRILVIKLSLSLSSFLKPKMTNKNEKNHFSNYVRRPKRGAISQDRDSNVGPVIGRLQVSDAGHCWIVEFEASFWVYSKLLPTISRAVTH